MVRLQVRAIPTTKRNCISTTDDTDDSDTVQTTSRPSPINNIASTYWTSSGQSTTDYIQRERTTHSWHTPTITISKGTASITYAAYSQAGWTGTCTYIVEFRYSNCHSTAATTTDAAAAPSTHSTSSKTTDAAPATTTYSTTILTYAGYAQAGWSRYITYAKLKHSNGHSPTATRTYGTRYSGTTRPTIHY